MTVGCEDCGSGWPPMLLATVPLEGCPACRPEAWRAFGSGENPPADLARNATKSD